MKNFWKDKIPCWELRGCLLYEECPAYNNQTIPCWETPDKTICEQILDIPRTCDLCRVYRLYKGSNN